MDDKIDSALLALLSLPMSKIYEMEKDGFSKQTAAEAIAAKLIISSMDNTNAMKILTERIGGKAVQRNISVNSNIGLADNLAGFLQMNKTKKKELK